MFITYSATGRFGGYEKCFKFLAKATMERGLFPAHRRFSDSFCAVMSVLIIRKRIGRVGNKTILSVYVMDACPNFQSCIAST